MLSKMLAELSAKMANKQLEDIKQTDPEEYDEVLKMFLTATKVGIHFLEESPQFREDFAKIHNKFLEYPESNLTIEKSIKVGKEYIKNN